MADRIRGFPRTGFLAADGTERIILNYDFTDPAYVGPDLTAIVEVEFDYVLAMISRSRCGPICKLARARCRLRR